MFHKARDYLFSIRKKIHPEYDLKKYQVIDYIKTNKNKVIMKIVPDFTIFYIANGISKCYTRVGKVSDDIMLKISYISENLNGIISLKHFSFALKDLFVGIAVVLLIEFYFYYKNKNAKKTRKGEEHGSARWGRKSDIINFQDLESYENNILLTQTESLRLNGRIKPKFQRNKNILVIGGSGSGKTRFFIKPNLMQMHSSYVVTDPKGTVVLETGKMLENAGYKIKILNTVNFKKSMRYNPFEYIKTEADILKFVNALMLNTKGEGDKGEDFWAKAEKLLYTAYIAYIKDVLTAEYHNFETLVKMINMSETSEDDENFKNDVDLMFEILEAEEPNNFAVRQYRKYKLSSGKTAKSILISCGARLAPFDIEELLDLTRFDELELDTLGDVKTALFIIISDTDSTFNFIVSLMYTQMFNLLCTKADDVYGGRLPVHVRCLLDEFANIGQIPMFDKLTATIRSREISASVVLQSIAQLKTLYKDSADTIIGNCDTTLFLGGKDGATLKEISENLGKETIDILNNSLSKGSSPSSSISYQKQGRDLMDRAEISVMDRSECILQIMGIYPFKSKKFDIEKHNKYKELEDFDKKNFFDIEKFLDTRLELKQGQEVINVNLGII